MSSYRRLNIFAIISLVLLRIGIGWHFFQEGAVKVREGNFTSIGFLSAAKGPLAKKFHEMIPDYEGYIRLTPELMEEAFDAFPEVVAEHYGFTEEQMSEAEKIGKKGKAEYKDAFQRWEKEIKDYLSSIDRVDKIERDPTRRGVATLRAQKDEIETKWKALPKPALAAIDKILKDTETDLNDLATDEQIEGKYLCEFLLPEETVMSTRYIDRIIPIFDMAIGILLIIGLLTPVAGLAAAIFLGSVVLSQFPGYPGTQPTYFQAAEMLGCLVLAATDAGRYWGLDYIPWTFWQVVRFGWRAEAE